MHPGRSRAHARGVIRSVGQGDSFARVAVPLRRGGISSTANPPTPTNSSPYRWTPARSRAACAPSWHASLLEEPDRRRVLHGPSAIILLIDEHQAFGGRREVVLTSKQCSILQLLRERWGEVVTQGDLVNSIGGRGSSSQSHNFIEAHRSRIRS